MKPPAAAVVVARFSVSVSTTAAAEISDPMIVSSASNTASLSSCRSLLYPLGRPFIVVRKPVSRPIARPALPRTSSIGSGFFFCGIRLLPVEMRSSRSMKPNSSLPKMMMSSASRLTWTMHSDTAWRNDDTKSRSATASMLLATTRENPRRARQRVHVDAVGVAGDRARAERQRVGLARHRGDALGVAAERGRVRQEPVRGEHGLRAPQMRVGRHQRVAGLLGLRDERRDDAHDQAIDRDQPPPQVEPQIDADLLVARAARMEALAGIADALDELALDPRVDVLVVALHDPRILAHRVEQRRQGAVDGGVLVGREHAGGARSPRPRPGCR